MIAANIGKIFLDAYNEKYKSNYSAKEFFVEKYYSVFFDHEKYMQWVINSPFVQGLKKGIAPTTAERKLKLDVLVKKISKNEADASIAIGFPSLDVLATTSGQITNLNLPLKEEEMYQSWIGSGFGIGVQGGLCILFDNPQILLDLYEGWTHYRDYLNTTSALKGNQINNWNGQWLAHRYNKRTFDVSNPTASFTPIGTGKEGGLEVKTESWSKILIGIAQNYPDSLMTSYVYSLVKVNITIGFIPFELPRIRQPFELYYKYFGTNKLEQVEQLFGTAIGFTKACQMGAIGVNALEPKGFRDCLDEGSIPVYNPENEDKTIKFNTYQIWLLAMLNNEQLWEKAQDIAATLCNYSKSDRDLRTKKSQEVTNLLASVNKKQFIESLIEIVKGSPETDQLAEIAEIIHTMPVDNVPYFLTLIRFQYAVVNKKS
ncbi:MAG: hypothetical protein CVT92_05565 [Bacteroidetes bacterium HGW-Bacteroidetes-1]|jgi:hypothetical protein|nr:MAG: hypothetical protein CVT92_05565 [Bacteroidetes bacterium HGW-Bacteroidetes-1]